MNTAKGWICLHRQVKDSWVWNDKPFAYGQAWIDLLLSANHEAAKFPLGNELVSVPKGALVTSELKLMERWGWSKTKVRRFLSLCESDGMIIKKSDRKKTTIYIVKWGVFQDFETTERLLKDYSETDKEPIKDTNNNENNENNKNNVNNREFTPPTLEELKVFCKDNGIEIDAERFINYYTANGWRVGRNKMQSWQAQALNWAKTEAPKAQPKSKMKSAAEYIEEHKDDGKNIDLALLKSLYDKI